MHDYIHWLQALSICMLTGIGCRHYPQALRKIYPTDYENNGKIGKTMVR